MLHCGNRFEFHSSLFQELPIYLSLGLLYSTPQHPCSVFIKCTLYWINDANGSLHFMAFPVCLTLHVHCNSYAYMHVGLYPYSINLACVISFSMPTFCTKTDKYLTNAIRSMCVACSGVHVWFGNVIKNRGLNTSQPHTLRGERKRIYKTYKLYLFLVISFLHLFVCSRSIHLKEFITMLTCVSEIYWYLRISWLPQSI